MVLEGVGRLIQAEGSRTLIYVSQKLVRDSAFPFEAGEKLKITIDQNQARLIVERGDLSSGRRVLRHSSILECRTDFWVKRIRCSRVGDELKAGCETLGGHNSTVGQDSE